MAPCRYFGGITSDDLVISAHNYRSHFGQLSSLESGACVIFKDIYDNVTEYVVAGIETLKPNQIEEMTFGEYPLTFFTCTYGGKIRVTLRCNYKDSIKNPIGGVIDAKPKQTKEF